MSNHVTNPGSALGEAIGKILEFQIHKILKPLVEQEDCIYVDTGLNAKKTGKNAKLLLTDNYGNAYNIDSVIINRQFQPLAIIESKYIRYTKHNRDKASWICTAHPRLREKYTTIRKSIAILMGNWSKPSKKLLQSFDVDLFEISFNDICDVLSKHGIDYNWNEKNREQSLKSWETFCSISSSDKLLIGQELIQKIEQDLREALENVLHSDVIRTINALKVTIRSNLEETYIYSFDSLEKAISFLESYQDKDMDTANAPVLLNSDPISSESSQVLDEAEEVEDSQISFEDLGIL